MNPRYWAFLSYSHADEAAASKLHRALEAYTLPASVRRAHGLPRRLVPVFRDVEDLEAAAGLTARLQAALDDSRWLIVLCSPASAKSKYVNSEIEYFLGKHGPARILCVLLEGAPPDCFPPAIRALKDEPLAADLRPGAELQLAVLKLIAAMATVGFTELRNREAARARRRRVAIAATLGGLALGGLAAWDLYYRHQVEYYASYVRRHGIWQGIDRLPEAVAARREFSLRFERFGRLHPPASVALVDGPGYCPNPYGLFQEVEALHNILEEEAPVTEPATGSDRYCMVSFRYQPDGSIASETLHNLAGAPVLTLLYTEPGLGQLTQKGFSASTEGGGVRYVQFDFDERGYARETHFLYGIGLPRANSLNAYGYRYERDDAGRVIALEPLDSNGKGRGDVERYLWGEPYGSLLESRAVDEAGRPLRFQSGMVFEVRRRRDAFGNVLRHDSLDETGRPMLSRWDIASWLSERDEHGNDLDGCRLGVDGKPRQMKPGGGACSRREMTREGWVARWSHFDGDGRPMLAGGGASTFTYEYDAAGHLIASAYLGLKGERIESWRGSVRNEYLRDEAGRILRERYFGMDDSLANTLTGAERRNRYDPLGRLAEVAYFDAQGAPMVIVGSPRVPGGFATMAIERDERGNVIARRYFDAARKPMLQADGYAALETDWNNAGNPVETRYFGTDGKLIAGREGFAVSRARYDAAGRRVEERYFDAHLAPVSTPSAHFGYLVDVNAAGRVLLKKFLNAAGQAQALPGEGYAAIRYAYEGLAEPVETAYLDERGEPRATGVAYEVRKYNEAQLPLEVRYQGRDRQSVAEPRSGCAVEIREYVGSYNLALEQCLDGAGRLVTRRDGGWARHVVTLENARPVRHEWFDAAGKPVKPKK